MGRVKVDHVDCGGWAVLAPEYMGETAKNYHILEVKSIYTDDEGKVLCERYNPSNAICKRQANSDWKYTEAFPRTIEGETAIRAYLAKEQSGGKEICGTCVSRFYADPEATE